MKKTKGVLLLAMGHPYYGRYAHNLAMSLKFSAPDLKICLAYAGNATTHFKDSMINLFDKIIEIPQKYYTRKNNTEYIKAKTAIYNLSPFDETIFLDVDMLWLPQKSIFKLFEELENIDFTMQNRGFIDMQKEDLPKNYVIWADINEVKKEYNIKKGKYYQLHSEFVYFKKTAKNKQLFNDTIKIYDNLKVNNFLFAGAIPDELPFSISMCLNEIYPHKDYFTPVYWEVIEKKRLSAQQMYAQYYAYSTGGSFHIPEMHKFYNNINTFYSRKNGFQFPFSLKDKRDWLMERKNL